ncbi:hypothetical protein ECA2700 [Pectobacterium atrosepticum SCRI1043]|uniref:Uncharacterized protein n=1 Tax=Pectobacterium atrosepticum (strain SCRI 1043 / ATCC BAA-672) TaxID=218491 RepID=Q6D3P4_PECAS|nr:hypothetical protein [Pectobacterium atrosepticum]MCL6315312.1 hypothetical protein [Pectobacterium atrosepticum]MCL6320452.1 hypothetical protein [Pectobacterium atrosepticum]CAG75600.1 hypothetical protein ECA2700 [Pectobacterium atrosepticum SCRI1043]
MMMEWVWWELTENDPDIKDLREQLTQRDVIAWHSVEALQEKYWVMNHSPARWGAIMLWREKKPALADLPPNRSAEIIGRAPDKRMSFTVAACCLNESHLAPLTSLFEEGLCTTMPS